MGVITFLFNYHICGFYTVPVKETDPFSEGPTVLKRTLFRRNSQISPFLIFMLYCKMPPNIKLKSIKRLHRAKQKQ